MRGIRAPQGAPSVNHARRVPQNPPQPIIFSPNPDLHIPHPALHDHVDRVSAPRNRTRSFPEVVPNACWEDGFGPATVPLPDRSTPQQARSTMFTHDATRRLLRGRPLTFARAVGACLMALVGLQALLQAGLAGGGIQGTVYQDDAEIVASGRSAMPSDPVAWRVVRDTAFAASDSAFKERALGFAIADQGELELIGDGIGPTVEIAPDGAGFIPEAVHQIHVSPSGQPTSYLRIGLVPPVDAGYTAGGELVYPGDGFAAPGGERELL